jgi:lipopolysaccharide export system permease protein
VLQSDIGRTKPSFVLKEQVINTVVDQKLYLRASTIDHASSRMKDVVIYDLSDPAHRRTIYADSGTLAIAANQTDLLMQLYHGVMQEVPTAHPEQLTRLYYKRQQLRMRNVTNSFQASNADSASKSDREMTVCEMQRALSDADYRYQQALYDRLNAQADILVAAGQHNVQRPNRPVKRNPLGLGSIYCGVVQRLFGVKVAQAAELPAHARFALADTGAVTVKDTVHAAPQGVVKDTAHAQPAGPPPSASPTPTPTPAGTLPGTTPVIQPPVPSSGLVNQPLAPMAQLRGTQEAALAREKLEGFQRIRYDIEIQKKFSLAAACIIFVLLGPPIALRFPRGGVGLVIGVSFLVFALYYVGLIGGESLANSGLIAPVWAMWGDNVLLLLIGLVLTTRMNRVVGATRGGDWSELRATLRQAARRVLHPFARGAE